MLLDELRRIDALRGAAPTELRSLAKQAHVLSIPSGRWLVRRGAGVGDYFFLLKGQVDTFGPRKRFKANADQPLHPFYPGCDAARTASLSRVLRIGRAHFDFAANHSAIHPTQEPERPVWLQRFFSSHMMQAVPSELWREVLRKSHVREFGSHTRVLRYGQPGDTCFLIEHGRVLIRRGSKILARLGPGGFFGEDALLRCAGRNADVVAIGRLRVHCIDAQVFHRVLVATLVQFVQSRRGGVLLNVGRSAIKGALPVSLCCLREFVGRYDPHHNYFVVGGSRVMRAACAFVLVQHGLQAYPVYGSPTDDLAPAQLCRHCAIGCP